MDSNDIKSEIRLEKAFSDSYRSEESDFRMLFYVAQQFADRYADLLRLGIHLKSEYVYPEYASLQNRITVIVDDAISQMEYLPLSALEAINKNIEEEIKTGKEITETIEFPDIISIPDEDMKVITEEINKAVSKATSNQNA